MDIVQAIILGLVQGLTEFLPISSSGHIILVPILFGFEDQGLNGDLEDPPIVDEVGAQPVVFQDAFRCGVREEEAPLGGTFRLHDAGNLDVAYLK